MRPMRGFIAADNSQHRAIHMLQSRHTDRRSVRSTQGTRALKALKALKHSSTRALEHSRTLRARRLTCIAHKPREEAHTLFPP